MKPRKRAPEEKMAIVLEGMKGDKSIAEVCRIHQISQTLYYRWRDAFLEGAKQGLAGKRPGENAHRAEVERLQNIIGKQTIIIDTLKKTEEMFGKS